MSRELTLHGWINARGRLTLGQKSADPRANVSVKLNPTSVTVRAAEARALLKQPGRTARVGPLRAWLTGKDDTRTLFVRDRTGQTVGLPLVPLKGMLEAGELFFASNLHAKLGELVDLTRALASLPIGSEHRLRADEELTVIEGWAYPGDKRIAVEGSILEITSNDGETIQARYVSPPSHREERELTRGDIVEIRFSDFRDLTTPADGVERPAGPPLLEVGVPDRSVRPEPVPATAECPHPERAANLEELARWVDRPGIDVRALGAAYDAMVGSLRASLIDGELPEATYTTIATFPREQAGFLGHYGRRAAGEHSDIVADLSGNKLRLRSRLGLEEAYPITRAAGRFTVTTPDGERSLTELLTEVFGFELPLPAETLLASMEVGGEAFGAPGESARLYRNGQAGAMLFDDGTIDALFTGRWANTIPPAQQHLFGYHSHPEADAPGLPLSARNVDPRNASGADLISFAQTAKEQGHPVPQVIWVKSGPHELTGRIFVPERDGPKYRTPEEPVAALRVSLDKTVS